MKSYTSEFIPEPTVTTPMSAGADLGIRYLARGIDLLLVYCLGYVSGFIGGIGLAILSSMGRLREDWLEQVRQPSLWMYVFGISGSLLYHFFAEGTGSTTLGKLICGLNVVQLDGRPCSYSGAFKRGVAYPVDALFFGWIAFESMRKTPLRQRHGDVWGKTVVVQKAVFLLNPKRPVWRIVAGVMVGSGAWMVAQVAQLFAMVYDTP